MQESAAESACEIKNEERNGKSTMKVTIEIPRYYDNAISFTVIGAGGGYTQNIANACFQIDGDASIKWVSEDGLKGKFVKEDNADGKNNNQC